MVDFSKTCLKYSAKVVSISWGYKLTIFLSQNCTGHVLKINCWRTDQSSLKRNRELILKECY